MDSARFEVGTSKHAGGWHSAGDPEAEEIRSAAFLQAGRGWVSNPPRKKYFFFLRVILVIIQALSSSSSSVLYTHHHHLPWRIGLTDRQQNSVQQNSR